VAQEKFTSGVVRTNLLKSGSVVSYLLLMTKIDPFKGFHTGPEIIRLAVML